MHFFTRLFAIKRDYSRLFAIILDLTCKRFKPASKNQPKTNRTKLKKKHPKTHTLKNKHLTSNLYFSLLSVTFLYIPLHSFTFCYATCKHFKPKNVKAN